MKHTLASRLTFVGDSRRPSFATAGLALVGVTVLTGVLWLAYEAGRQVGSSSGSTQVQAQGVRQALDTQIAQMDRDRKRSQEHLDALALRLGTLQSAMLRLEALGQQLVSVGQLDPEEFDFDSLPARGGIGAPEIGGSTEPGELLAEMEALSKAIEDRAHKLRLMRGLIVDSKIQEQLKPQGRPVEKGWISSRYGYRKDPFSGKKTFHHGVDIAGKKDSDVFAVAAGVVTEAERKVGYGYLVEIAHADGLVTRYAHNSKIFVTVGDLLSKGDRIGLMGSTGRSTGPHVHFEIAKNGKSINPAKYLRSQ